MCRFPVSLTSGVIERGEGEGGEGKKKEKRREREERGEGRGGEVRLEPALGEGDGNMVDSV